MFTLNRHNLLQLASQQIGTDDFGSTTFHEPLGQLLRSLGCDSRLTQPGLRRAIARFVMDLRRRALIANFLRQDASVTQTRIEEPVFVIGLPRTGTTLMHKLLAADEKHRALRLWELQALIAPPDATDQWQQQQILRTQQIVELAMTAQPRLREIHPVHAEAPDECNWLFRNSFATIFHGFSYYIPSYVDWLMEQSMEEEYAYHRLQLQAILTQRAGHRLVLKDPCHTWHLNALLREFPDAWVVHLHRDLPTVTASFCSLCRALHELNTGLRELGVLGKYALGLLTTGAERVVAARRSLSDDRIIDVSYSEFVQDPPATLQSIYERTGRDFNERLRDSIASQLAEGKKFPGRHKYDFTTYGLETSRVNERFQSYVERFGEFTKA